MFGLHTILSMPARTLAVVFAVVLGVVLAPSPAFAAVTVSRAEVGGGSLRIEGRAIADRAITVDGVAMGTSDEDGDFRVSRSGYTPPADCTVAVDDGSLRPVTVTLSGCAVTAAPSPAMLPDSPEIGPFNVGVQVPTTVVSLSNAIGPTQWTVSAGALPSGLSLVVPEPGGRPSPPENQTYAEIRGTPTTVQTSTVTLRATDANGLTATRTYTIRINPAVALGITPQSWPPLGVGEGANLWFTGSGGLLPYRWSVTAGALPPGMTLVQDDPDGELARVAGTPTTSGTFTWTLRLTDAQATTVEGSFTATVEPASALSSLTISPARVTAASSATGTVTLDSPAPAAGAEVALSSSDPSVASVNVRVFVLAAETTATFPISTSAVTSSTTVTVSASYAGATRSATVTVDPASSDPASPDPVAVSGLNLAPSAVTGGSETSTATVTLTAPAPSGGALISVTSSSPAATVPGTVTVPAGATTATFTIDTTAVVTSTSVTIAATHGGVTRSAALTVSPASTAPSVLTAPSLLAPANEARWAPGVSRTFDWTDVSGAATYTIQISSSSAFTTIQLERVVTTSQIALSFSSQGTRYWRVRASDSTSTAGPWSATRSFRIKS